MDGERICLALTVGCTSGVAASMTSAAIGSCTTVTAIKAAPVAATQSLVGAADHPHGADAGVLVQLHL